MMEKFNRALALGGACWRVLMLDKEMLLFPILSVLALGGVLGMVFTPAYMHGTLQQFAETLEQSGDPYANPSFVTLMFLLYFLGYFIVTFFNAGLLTCAMIRMSGEDPTVMDGLRASSRMLPQIFAWALFAASVGMILNFISSRSKGLGKFFAGLMGVAWSVAVYFAVPALVVEGVGPVRAVRQSIGMIRKTWGEALVANAGLSILHAAAIYLTIPFVFFLVKDWEQDPVRSMLIAAVLVFWVVVTGLIVSTLNAILRAALYIYAYEGRVPENFDSHIMRNAFSED
ncbi:DUF6159 family protein [Breoghania sp.]|uniref:DUF6159 family protein n=1 Tax=Breoghania sp. TaxID=2065378 RepID=UPI002AA940FD|nr:DUF6159 family protein [Breoghania sp.]